MIGTSTPEYVFIRASIAALRTLTPLSLLYCGFALFRPPRTILTKVLLAYATLESAFYLLVYIPKKCFLQRPARHPELLSFDQRQSLFRRCYETIPKPDSYLTKWFLGSPLEHIKRENIKEFWRWAFLNTAYSDVSDSEELEGYTETIEQLLQRNIEPGRGPAKSLRLTVDKVDMLHRPFLWYMIVGIVDISTAARLKLHSFRFCRIRLSRFFSVFPFRFFTLFCSQTSVATDISYWYRPHTSKTRLPVLFIHGIGIGLHPYVNFLAEINERNASNSSDGEIGVIALELMPISFRITSPALAKAEMCRQIDDILKAHGWDNFVLASHSYGTVISTHLLQTAPLANKIDSFVLIDPVTFLLHLPDVAYNFTARKPQGANEHQLYYFASKDMMVAHTLSRHFFWSENILWRADLASRNVTVALGGRDLIVNTEAVGRYLVAAGPDDLSNGSWKDEPWIGDGLDILWFQQCDHAQVFEQQGTRQRLVDVVRQYSRHGRQLIRLA